MVRGTLFVTRRLYFKASRCTVNFGRKYTSHGSSSARSCFSWNFVWPRTYVCAPLFPSFLFVLLEKAWKIGVNPSEKAFKASTAGVTAVSGNVTNGKVAKESKSTVKKKKEKEEKSFDGRETPFFNTRYRVFFNS